MEKRTYRILFIGNSHTYFNDMPYSLFEPIARSAGYDVEIDSVVKGGWTLDRHLDINSATGEDIERALTGVPYDYVVLQEQSLLPMTERERFHGSVRKFVSRIRDTGATPILYATWARKTGSVKLTELGVTSETMTFALADSYADIGRELSVEVAQVGLAFFDIGDAFELYNADKLHASPLGSYLAALMLFYRIFGYTDVSWDGGISPEIIEMLKKAAKDRTLNIYG